MAVQNLRFTSPDKQHVAFELPNGGGSMSVDKFQELFPDVALPSSYVAPAATWDSVRAERNQLLKDTDWQGMSDVTMSDAQKAYRQKLRDLPATNADPTKIVFPDAP